MCVEGGRYFGDGAADRREIWPDGSTASQTCLLSVWGLHMRGQKIALALLWTIFGLSVTEFCHLTANSSKTVSCIVTCQLEHNISSTSAF